MMLWCDVRLDITLHCIRLTNILSAELSTCCLAILLGAKGYTCSPAVEYVFIHWIAGHAEPSILG